MRWYDPAKIEITGPCDWVYAIKRIVEKIDEIGSVGAGVTVIAKTGNGSQEVGYFDGDGGGRVTVSDVQPIDDRPLTTKYGPHDVEGTMNNLEQLEQKHKELGEEIERLKKQDDMPDILWSPNKGEKHWILTGHGICSDLMGISIENSNRIKRQQPLKTLEQAQKADRQRIAKMKVLRRVAELNHERGWVCDWDDYRQPKYRPQLEHNTDVIEIFYSFSKQSLPTEYYAVEGVWHQVIEEMEDSVKLGLWGIE